LVKKAKKGEDGRQLVNPFSEGLWNVTFFLASLVSYTCSEYTSIIPDNGTRELLFLKSQHKTYK
jgi:hypothetical protein